MARAEFLAISRGIHRRNPGRFSARTLPHKKRAARAKNFSTANGAVQCAVSSWGGCECRVAAAFLRLARTRASRRAPCGAPPPQKRRPRTPARPPMTTDLSVLKSERESDSASWWRRGSSWFRALSASRQPSRSCCSPSPSSGGGHRCSRCKRPRSRRRCSSRLRKPRPARRC